MTPELVQRPQWEIDKVLEALIGQNIRVAARSFTPTRPQEAGPIQFALVRHLYLPDNSQPGSLPVYFEGVLRQFERRVAVVYVCLGSRTTSERVPDGPIHFRGKIAVIVQGPALIELAYPFRIERLPGDAVNYWADLRFPTAQFRLPFDSLPETVLYSPPKESR